MRNSAGLASRIGGVGSVLTREQARGVGEETATKVENRNGREIGEGGGRKVRSSEGEAAFSLASWHAGFTC